MEPLDRDEARRLGEGLRGIYGVGAGADREAGRGVDEAVMRAARVGLAGRRRRMVVWRVGVAAAAVLAVGVGWVGYLVVEGREGARVAMGTGAGGTTERGVGGGGVAGREPDIVDVWWLARRVERGEAGVEDVNGDGRGDASDVSALAGRVVALKSAGGETGRVR